MFRPVIFSMLIMITSCTTAREAASPNYSREIYIQSYASLAVQEMIRSGIPASITLAQGILESGNGNSTLARKSNNHFGIKCHQGWKGQKVHHDDDARNECFRRYPKVEDSYRDHSDFLMTRPRYSFLFEIPYDKYQEWARGLKKAGYATDPHYANRLIKIIEENKLYKFDVLTPAEAKRYIANVYTPDKELHLIKTTEPREVKYNNGTKYIRARSGDTFNRIASEYNIKEWEIFHYNDLEFSSIPEEGQIVYLEPKRSKAHRSHDTHTVDQQQSLHSIAQAYGVKLKKLAKRNDLNKKAVVQPGMTLELR